ncbi:MAG TPA: hypothetical protein VKQ52_09775 [Puia sp.]|nr:hypothetical protein [Puia sp.]
MKKITALFALSFLLLTGAAHAATTVPAYAATTAPGVPAAISREFSEKFAKATDIRWETMKGYYKATFSINGKTLFAFYTDRGNLMGVAHNLSPLNLPQPLREEIKSSYAGYWITDLFTYHNADENGVVITLENADKVIVLKSTGSQVWDLYRSSVKS